MKLKTIIDLWRSGQSVLALRLFRTNNEFYREEEEKAGSVLELVFKGWVLI